MAIVYCQKCGKEFYAKPFWLTRGYGKYCSSSCQYAGMRKGAEKPCHMCGAMTYKTAKQLVRSKSGLFFCGKTCQTIWRNQLFVEEKHKNFKTGIHAYRSILSRNNVPKECALCKNTDGRVLAVHHIDKNRKNNKLKNLAWLCHNCHFLVHHDRESREKFMAAIV